VAPSTVKNLQSNGGHLEAGVAAKLSTMCSGIVEWWFCVARRENQMVVIWNLVAVVIQKLMVGLGARVKWYC